MDTVAIRQRLHEYIERVDDRKIEGLYLLVEDEIHRQQAGLSAEELLVVHEEREKYVKGESRVYSMEEAREIILNKQKK